MIIRIMLIFPFLFSSIQLKAATLNNTETKENMLSNVSIEAKASGDIGSYPHVIKINQPNIHKKISKKPTFSTKIKRFFNNHKRMIITTGAIASILCIAKYIYKVRIDKQNINEPLKKTTSSNDYKPNTNTNKLSKARIYTIDAYIRNGFSEEQQKRFFPTTIPTLEQMNSTNENDYDLLNKRTANQNIESLSYSEKEKLTFYKEAWTKKSKKVTNLFSQLYNAERIIQNLPSWNNDCVILSLFGIFLSMKNAPSSDFTNKEKYSEFKQVALQGISEGIENGWIDTVIDGVDQHERMRQGKWLNYDTVRYICNHSNVLNHMQINKEMMENSIIMIDEDSNIISPKDVTENKKVNINLYQTRSIEDIITTENTYIFFTKPSYAYAFAIHKNDDDTFVIKGMDPHSPNPPFDLFIERLKKIETKLSS